MSGTVQEANDIISDKIVGKPDPVKRSWQRDTRTLSHAKYWSRNDETETKSKALDSAKEALGSLSVGDEDVPATFPWDLLRRINTEMYPNGPNVAFQDYQDGTKTSGTNSRRRRESRL